MGKDPEKYLYVTFGILRNSEAAQRFLADAEEHHMAEHTGKLAGLRLTEYYKLRATGQISPSLFALLGKKDVSTSDSSRDALPPVTRKKVADEDSSLPTSDAAERNASGAVDYWSAM